MAVAPKDKSEIRIGIAGALSLVSSVAGLLGVAIKDWKPGWAPPWLAAVLVGAVPAYLAVLLITRHLRAERNPAPVPDTIAGPVPPPPTPGVLFPGQDYTEDVLDGIRWRWRWQVYEDDEPKAVDFRVFCGADGCDYEIEPVEKGSRPARETALSCPRCLHLWNRRGSWGDLRRETAVVVERDRRTGGRGWVRLKPYREEA